MTENYEFDPMGFFGDLFLNAIVNLNDEEMDKMSEVFSSAANRLSKEKEEAGKETKQKKEEEEEEEELPFCDGDCESCSEYVNEDEEEEDDDEDEDFFTEKSFDVDKILMSKNKMTVVWADGTKTHVVNTFEEKMTPWTGFCAAVAERLYDSKETALMQLEYGLDRGAV